MELEAKQVRLAEMADKLMERDDPVMEAAYERFKARVDEDARALKASVAQQEHVQSKLSPAELAARAQAIRDQISTSADARRLMQTYLDQLIDVIQMEPVSRTATIVMFDGLLNIKLDAKGQLIGKADARSMLDVPGEHDLRAVIAGSDPTRRAKLGEVLERFEP